MLKTRYFKFFLLLGFLGQFLSLGHTEDWERSLDAIKRSTPKLTMPKELANNEYVVTEKSGYDDHPCTKSLKYFSPSRYPLIISTTKSHLIAAKKLKQVDSFINIGNNSRKLDLTNIFCSDAAFHYHADIGSLNNQRFKKIRLILVDIAQDICIGDIEVVGLTRKSEHFVGFALHLGSLLPEYKCDQIKYDTVFEVCEKRRNDCLRKFLAGPKKISRISQIKEKVNKFVDSLKFSEQ